MATTTADNIQIIGGVDTHQDLHTAAVVSHDGTVLGTESFSTTRAGYRAMLRWFRSHGELLRVGVESTGTYGAGITRHLALSGIPVLEVTGPDPASRRAKGKDDALDAISAAEAARNRGHCQLPASGRGSCSTSRTVSHSAPGSASPRVPSRPATGPNDAIRHRFPSPPGSEAAPQRTSPPDPGAAVD